MDKRIKDQDTDEGEGLGANSTPPIGGSWDDPNSYSPRFDLDPDDPSESAGEGGETFQATPVARGVPTQDEVWDACAKLFELSHKRPNIHEIAAELGVHHYKIRDHYNSWKSETSSLIDLSPHVTDPKTARKIEKSAKKMLSDFREGLVDIINDQLVGRAERLQKQLDAETSARAKTLHDFGQVARERDQLTTTCANQASALQSSTAREQQAIGEAKALEKDKAGLQKENNGLQQQNAELRAENGELRAENAGIRQENEELRAQNAWLQSENNRLKGQAERGNKPPQPDPVYPSAAEAPRNAAEARPEPGPDSVDPWTPGNVK